MALPAQVNDGNWSQEIIDKCDLTYPFSSKGDGVSVEATLTITVDKASYRPRQLGDIIAIPLVSGGTVRGYCVDPGNPQDIGNGLFQIRPVYASLPVTRVEGSTTIFNIPLTDSIDVETFSIPTSAEIVYEYFLALPTPLIAFNILQGFGVIYIIQGSVNKYGASPPTSSTLRIIPGKYVSENSEVGIYKGKMYYRRTVYAVIPPNFVLQPGLIVDLSQ